MSDVQLRLLGPMELRIDRQSVPLGPAKQRTVLAALAVDAGRPVPLETLIERVWDDDPPEQVRTTLYSYVTRLRRVLDAAGDAAGLRRHAAGYLLDVDPDAVDLLRFTRLLRSAGVEEALELWQGPALADLSGEWVGRTRQAIEQQRVDAVVEWGRTQVASDPAAVVDTVRELAAAHPLVEPLAALLIDALHRAGRAAEALDRYAKVRQHLVDELGTEPGLELREVHGAILRGERPPPIAPAAPPARAMLPAGTGAFTGRAGEIEQIVAAAAGGNIPMIHAIAGMPGIGKTALAVHVANRLREQFPDGQLFVDLHGHTAGRAPADPGDVLAGLLSADGVDPRKLPAGTEARAAQWRERLADRRMLIVLDNAADSAQVLPLLPGSSAALVLVTSRRFLGDLPSDAVAVSLDVLTPPEAEQMFRRLAPRDDLDGGTEVTEVVAQCGYLPLAISLLARVLRRHPRWTVADLLQETRSRLLEVTAEHASVAAAFELSYQDLPTGRQRFFRLLAAHPGTEVEPSAAAALAGCSVGEAAEQLNALHADSLLIEVGYRRYTMHDLIRSYAVVVSDEDASGAPIERLLDFYERAAAMAGARLSRLTRPVPADRNVPDVAVELTDRERALAWLRAERANLRACLGATDDPRRIVALTAGLAELLRRDGPWTEALVLHADAVRAAGELGDDLEQANALADRATIRRLSGDNAGAERDVRQALELYRRVGNRRGEANALNGLGKVLSRAGDYTRSTTVVREAIDGFRDLGDRQEEAGALVELAIAVGMLSDFRGAQDLLHQALDRYRRLGDRPGEAYALRILGIAHGRVGDFTGALDLLTMALEQYRELGSRLGQALTYNDLGRAAAGLGDYRQAARALRTALRQHRENGHRIGQSTALMYLGGALRRAGDLTGAAEALQEALVLDRKIRNRSGEAMVLNEIGAVHRLAGDLDRAVAAHREALDVAERLFSPWDKAQSLAGFGRCELARGRRPEGVAQLRSALTIFRQVNAAEAVEVADELAALT